MFDVFGFYKFIKISSLEKKKIILQKFLNQKKVRGTIILSPEGINGTIAGNKKNINSVIHKLKKKNEKNNIFNYLFNVNGFPFS